MKEKDKVIGGFYLFSLSLVVYSFYLMGFARGEELLEDPQHGQKVVLFGISIILFVLSIFFSRAYCIAGLLYKTSRLGNHFFVKLSSVLQFLTLYMGKMRLKPIHY